MLASVPDPEKPRYTRYIISNYGKLYFWTPSSGELLYVTELYSLTRTLNRMEQNFDGIKTKPLKSLYQHYPSGQPLRQALWFWQVPKAWSQSLVDLHYLQHVVLGCYQYGLPLSVPLLVSNGLLRSGSIEFLLKSGEEYYFFYEMSTDLVHIDEPTSLQAILRLLRNGQFEDFKTTLVNVLPEFGGPNVVADHDVPEGWTKKVREDAMCSCGSVFFDHGIYDSTTLLFQDGGPDGAAQYLVQGEAENFYIWSPDTHKIRHIDKAEGLQDILDILKDASRQLSLSEVEAECRFKDHSEQ